MDAQKLFLSALAKQAKEELSLSQTVALVGRSFGKIKTDMSLNDCIACAKQLRGVALSELHMATLPGASARTGGNSGAWYYVLNREATAQLLERTVGANAPFDPDGVFNDASRGAFDRIYRASADSVRLHEYTAQGALDGELSVQRVG
jgi:anionic cell wall polymer biosynthesis LytR-Cps2A-Psr (LCP) family protein